MEHVYNTTVQRELGVTPFEASHGLPARGVTEAMRPGAEYKQPELIDQKGIEAMGATARAFEELARQAQLRSHTDHADKANSKGVSQEYKRGDRVSFYIPPTADEAKQAGRKQKHLPHWRGPATVTKVLSGSTYAIEHHDCKYQRSAAELRRYKADGPPLELPMANHSDLALNEFVIGNYVALCDEDDPQCDQYHVAKVVSLNNGKAQLLNYCTATSNIKNAKWQVLHQHEDGRFRRGGKATGKWEEVLDEVSLDDADGEFGYVRHFRLQMLDTSKLAAASRKQLADMELKHHVLGRSFP